MDGNAEKFKKMPQKPEEQDATRAAYIQEPWDDEKDTSRFLEGVKVIDMLRDAASAFPKEQHSEQAIQGYFNQFETYHDVFEKTLDKWNKNEPRSRLIPHTQKPYTWIIQYIEAAAKLGEKQGDPNKHIDLSVSLLGKYLNKFTQVFSDSKDSEDLLILHNAFAALNTHSLYVGYGKDEDTKQKAAQFLTDNLDFIDQQMQPDARTGHVANMKYFPLILQIYKYGSEEQKHQASQIVLRTVSVNSVSSSAAIRFFNKESLEYAPFIGKLEEEFLKIVEDQLGAYGLDVTEITRHWTVSEDMILEELKYARGRLDKSLPSTLINLKILEESRPGSAKVLQERFGIDHFGRYPVEILLRQYDERDDTSKPYGVILGAVDDYEEVGAMNVNSYKELFDGIGDQFSIRITECDSKYGPNGIGRRLLNFDNWYYQQGKGHKIGFLIITGHGNVEGTRMWFGRNNDSFSRLTTSDFQRPRVESVASFFEERPEIVFISCNVGRELAKVVSHTLHARVFANTESINRVTHFKPQVQEEKVLLDPEYTVIGEQNRVVFIDGVEQPESVS